METSYLIGLIVICALISVAGATASLFIVRRGADAETKADVSELSILVDRLAKEQRRERMSRVRRGEKDSDNAGGFPIPPGAEGIPVGQEAPLTAKDELRRRVMAARR